MGGSPTGARAITVPGGSTPFPIIAALTEDGGVDWPGWAVKSPASLPVMRSVMEAF